MRMCPLGRWHTRHVREWIVEFTPPQLATSAAPVPSVTILGQHRTLYYPYTPVFDSSGNLWVTNQFGNSIVEYTPAQLATSGSPIPVVTISDNNGSLDGPVGSVLDSSGDLWVANYRIDTVVEYSSAQRAVSGSPVPVLTIRGTNTGLKYPVGTAVSP